MYLVEMRDGGQTKDIALLDCVLGTLLPTQTPIRLFHCIRGVLLLQTASDEIVATNYAHMSQALCQIARKNRIFLASDCEC